AYRETAAARIAASDGSKVSDDPATQTVCARAAATIDEVRLVMRRNLDDLMTRAQTGADMPLELRGAYRYDSSTAVDKCMHAIDEMFTASGGRAIFLGHPLLRYFLDVHAARAHYANNPEKPARNYGGLQLRLKTQDFFI